MTGTIRQLCARGDRAVAYDTEVAESVEQAERIIAQAVARKQHVFAGVPGQPMARVTALDRTAPEHVILVQMVGG